MILSLDVGGSKIAVGLVKKDKVFYFQKFQWSGKITQQKFLNQILKIVSDFVLRYPNLTAIAMAVAGQVNKKGEVFLTRNLIRKKTKISFKKILEKKFKLPVFVENDANCFALAEAIYGKGKHKNLIVGLTLGTGIGGGIVINKKIIRGKDGLAGEFGHMIVEKGGKKCSCGKKGCFEAYASVTALKNFYYLFSGKKISGSLINQAFQKKDKKAIKATEQTAEFLAVGLSNVIDIFDPDVIVVGGGLINFNQLIKKAVLKTEKILGRSCLKNKIFISNLKNKAPLIGASLSALS